MKKKVFILLSKFFLVLLIIGCSKEQYQGHHLHVSKHQELRDEHNNFHVKETRNVLNKNEEKKAKREKQAEKKRAELVKMNSKTNAKLKKKRSLDFDYY